MQKKGVKLNLKNSLIMSTIVVAVLAFFLVYVKAVSVPSVSTNLSTFSNGGFVRGGGVPINYTFNITNNESSIAYDEVRIIVPTNNVTYVGCTGPTSEWTCSQAGSTITFGPVVTDTIVAGASRLFNIYVTTLTTASQTGNITWQARGVNAGGVLGTTNFQTSIDNSTPTGFTSSIDGKTENTWLNDTATLTLNCSGATDTGSGVNTTNYKFQFYNSSVPEWVTVGAGNVSAIPWIFPTNFEQVRLNVSCNATDLVQNAGATDVAFFTGYDNRNPALLDIRINDSDLIVRSAWLLNVSANASDAFLVNVTARNSSVLILQRLGDAPGSGVIAGNFSNWSITAAEFCSSVGTSLENTCIISFSVYDNATNTNSSTLTLQVDDQAPRITANYTNLSVSTVRTGSSVNVTVNITDINISSVLILSSQNGTGVFNITTMARSATVGTLTSLWISNKTADICYAIAGGPCYLRINATDIAGNWND